MKQYRYVKSDAFTSGESLGNPAACFMTPPKHVNFRAKKLCGAVGNIVDAYEGHIPHACWNNIEGVTKMIGITVV